MKRLMALALVIMTLMTLTGSALANPNGPKNPLKISQER